MPDQMHEDIEHLRLDMGGNARAAQLPPVAINLAIVKDENHRITP